MLSALLNHLIADGKLEIFTVVKVVRYTVNSVIAKLPATDKVYNKIITLHDVELLISGKEIGGKLGNPKVFSYGEEVPEDLLTHPLKPVCLRNTSVERIRPGLICVHSQWEKLRMTDKCLSGLSASSNVQTKSFVQLLDQPQKPTQSSLLGISPAGSNFRHPTTNKSASTLITQPANMSDLSAQQTQSVSSTKKIINAVSTSNESMEYIVNFLIDGQQYYLKASFTRSNKKILGSLTLSHPSSKPRTMVKGGKHVASPIKENDDLNRPRAVWADLNGEQHKFCHLKKSWISDRYWVSEHFDGSFLLQPNSECNRWKPLICLLWIEFDTYSGGERNALKQLTELYVQQNQCDVQFNFEDDQHIGGHSHILVARSPVFAAMFQHEMKETKTGQVSIQDIQPDIFKQLLQYIYSGRLSLPLTETTAQRLFEAADKYDIGDLKEECVSFLLTCVRMDTVINLMAWAHLHFVDELKQLALKFTVLNAKEVCILKDWEMLTKNYPHLCVMVTRHIIDRMSISWNDEEELICSGINCL
ncbi:uncharacterized protein LOC124327651 [Daphnia pulicaria]|uniref:uncharacterized protein LOC124327651 n=1 Tax=Daphnia pulicaria TaxID=35523 RepID=UPI001EEA4421|nr:uncharacterized protein LOC124327651 [Daphnia pulicaria]XP_046642601.1 uncharacterized protein LOC124327651 [Daphnia pulicaria]XP_046642602.1 uncharacterized protein LOC124327651 [Daphnia pulicaria]XP_046642603.1 uncharacterized protein LOC124327651 [Daphnia pulicaria]